MEFEALKRYFQDNTGHAAQAPSYAQWLNGEATPYIRKHLGEAVTQSEQNVDQGNIAQFGARIMFRILDLCKEDTRLCGAYRDPFYELCLGLSEFYQGDADKIEHIAQASLDMARMIPLANTVRNFQDIEQVSDQEFSGTLVRLNLGGSCCGSSTAQLETMQAFTRQQELTEQIWNLQDENDPAPQQNHPERKHPIRAFFTRLFG